MPKTVYLGLTLANIKAVGPGFHQSLGEPSAGNCRKFAVNGPIQLDPHDPNFVRVPVKYGLNTYEWIESDNVGARNLYSFTGNPVIDVCPFCECTHFQQTHKDYSPLV